MQNIHYIMLFLCLSYSVKTSSLENSQNPIEGE